MAAKIPTIATTIISSIRVKPCCKRFIMLLREVNTYSLPLGTRRCSNPCKQVPYQTWTGGVVHFSGAVTTWGGCKKPAPTTGKPHSDACNACQLQHTCSQSGVTLRVTY